MKFWCRIALVLLTAGSTLAVNGQGTIIYHDPTDIPVFGGGIPVYYDLDVDGNGVNDFQFRA